MSGPLGMPVVEIVRKKRKQFPLCLTSSPSGAMNHELADLALRESKTYVRR